MPQLPKHLIHMEENTISLMLLFNGGQYRGLISLDYYVLKQDFCKEITD
jgi:hypothetical protein